jgi:hypothetical protein
MAKRLKNMSRGGYIVVGFLVAMLLVPSSMAVAAALKYTGIEGAGGSKAIVTPAGSLSVAASPSSPTGQINPGSSWTTVFDASETAAIVVTSINVDTWAVTPGVNSAIQFGLSQDGCLSVSSTIEAVNPGAIGETSVSLGPGGLSLTGVSLCAINDDPAHLSAAVFALYSFA